MQPVGGGDTVGEIAPDRSAPISDDTRGTSLRAGDVWAWCASTALRTELGHGGQVEVHETETGVEVNKGRLPMWPGLLIVPLVFLAPIVAQAMWTVAVVFW